MIYFGNLQIVNGGKSRNKILNMKGKKINMIRCFFKIFGIVFALLAELAVGICGTCIAFNFNIVGGIIAIILTVSIFVATVATIANYYT